jgi:hypothetical protein
MREPNSQQRGARDGAKGIILIHVTRESCWHLTTLIRRALFIRAAIPAIVERASCSSRATSEIVRSSSQNRANSRPLQGGLSEKVLEEAHVGLVRATDQKADLRKPARCRRR